CWARPSPPWSTRFPYTTLFRSALHLHRAQRGELVEHLAQRVGERLVVLLDGEIVVGIARSERAAQPSAIHDRQADRSAERRDGRSEEHTSELQSRENLVCRLLL